MQTASMVIFIKCPFSLNELMSRDAGVSYFRFPNGALHTNFQSWNQIWFELSAKSGKGGRAI